MIVERADGLRDRHVVVVQDDQQVGVRGAGVVQRLERHAGAHRAVADHRDDRARFALALRRDRHAERSAKSTSTNARCRTCRTRFRSRRGKPGGTAGHPQAAHRVAASGQDLVRIRLVADVPDQAVARRVEYVMQRNGQLDRAEVRRQMPARLCHRLEHECPQLARELRQRPPRQLAQRGRLSIVSSSGYCNRSIILGVAGRPVCRHMPAEKRDYFTFRRSARGDCNHATW